MKLQFKKQAYQSLAVDSVVNCFTGQPSASGSQSYRIGTPIVDVQGYSQEALFAEAGFRNGEIEISEAQLLENIQRVQSEQNLPQSRSLREFKTLKQRSSRSAFEVDVAYTKKALEIAPYHLDIEMETGTGKTYCYIKSIFELNKRYGWSKFIIVVPSIAIREGVYTSFGITAEHFLQDYGKRAKVFVYNSKQLHNIESFSSDAGINVMVINVQAFNSPPKENATLKTKLSEKNKIYRELDGFQSRRPIDVIKANRPVLILDEPQKMGGPSTLDSLREFNALFILRYSATHTHQHSKVHRLDALDAYNQKLVKKIAVRGISVKGLAGTNAYLYLESISVSKRSPVARVDIEIQQKSGIKRSIRNIGRGDNLHEKSGGLDQYKGFVVADVNATTASIEFLNGHTVHVGEATGDVQESLVRRIQIREAIQAHFEREQFLFHKGIKVLTLFFIDSVAKYRVYGDSGEDVGEYARMFEEEYRQASAERMQEESLHRGYKDYLNAIPAEKTHNGYFSIDKKSTHLIDPATRKRSNEADDADAYDLILRDKERLLSLSEPTRFIFSHSALREGWDNPNVFVICTLKHSDNSISRRQEVGRGLRIAVNQHGERQDNPATVHEVNVLTVVASESYRDFVSALQKDISESLSDRPRFAHAEYFRGKILRIEAAEAIVGATADASEDETTQTVKISQTMADGIEFYLIQNNYVDRNRTITPKFHEDQKNNALAKLPNDLHPYAEQIFQLINSLYSDSSLPEIENSRTMQANSLNANFDKSEFKELWSRINRKAAFTVHFESSQLVEQCIREINTKLRVTTLQYLVERAEQVDNISADVLKAGRGFQVKEHFTETTETKATSGRPARSGLIYDLIGSIAGSVQLTRKTVAKILKGIEESKFKQYKANPESFIAKVSEIIQEQKSTTIIEYISYNVLNETYDIDIFTTEQRTVNLSKEGDVTGPLKKHIYDYAITDSKTERSFVEKLDTSREVVVYAKLPKGFYIPTPVGNYNPDWAIAFREGSVKHVYFVAETKGSMSSLELRKIEGSRIECARRFFNEINRSMDSRHIRYGVVSSFSDLMELVAGQAE